MPRIFLLTSTASPSAIADWTGTMTTAKTTVLRSDRPEGLVGEQPDEVVDADEGGRPRRDQPGVREGEDEGEDDRDDQEGDQQHAGRDEHQPRDGGGALPDGLAAMAATAVAATGVGSVSVVLTGVPLVPRRTAPA